MNSKFSLATAILGAILGIVMRDMGFGYPVILATAVLVSVAMTWICRRAGIGMLKPEQVLKQGE